MRRGASGVYILNRGGKKVETIHKSMADLLVCTRNDCVVEISWTSWDAAAVHQHNNRTHLLPDSYTWGIVAHFMMLTRSI